MASDIAQNLKQVVSSLPATTRLVAVSKFHPVEQLQQAYDAGQRLFGESHVQELCRKAPLLPQDIEWHFIGHLQTNKVKYIVGLVSMIESVDSLKLLHEINRQAERIGRTVDVLLELHIAQEESKYGFSFDDVRSLLQQGALSQYPHVRVCGLMTMASFVDDQEQIASEFQRAKDFFDEVKSRWFSTADYFRECSWGMSHDYPIAVDHGATLVRVGTLIFGERA